MHQPLVLSPQFTIPPTDQMDFCVYQTIMAKSMCPDNSNHPLFKSIFSTPDFQSTHNECMPTHVDQNIGHAQLTILQDTVGAIPYFRLLFNFFFTFLKFIYKTLPGHLQLL